MKTHKFTQGPWHVGGVGGCRPSMVYGPNGRTVARTWSANLADGSEEDQANGALIAAGPDLVAAAETALLHLDTWFAGNPDAYRACGEACNILRAAVARAVTP